MVKFQRYSPNLEAINKIYILFELEINKNRNNTLIMNRFLTFIFIFLILQSIQTTFASHIISGDKPSDWKEQKISADDLVKWKLLGQGKAFNIFNGQTCLSEAEESQGLMLISPDSYGDIMLRYKILALTPATVLVTILSASDGLNKNTLTIPSGYEGGMKLLNEDSRNYLFAYKNAPHGANPFVLKNPGSVQTANASGPDLMVAGVYYDVEIVKSGKSIRMSIDGKRVVEMQDNSPHGKGNILFRIRGTAGLTASCLIRDLSIFTPVN